MLVPRNYSFRVSPQLSIHLKTEPIPFLLEYCEVKSIHKLIFIFSKSLCVILANIFLKSP